MANKCCWVYCQLDWRKPVFVHSYIRVRYGKREFVREHRRCAWGTKKYPFNHFLFCLINYTLYIPSKTRSSSLRQIQTSQETHSPHPFRRLSPFPYPPQFP